MSDLPTLTGTIIFGSAKTEGVIVVEGRTFVLRGPLLRGLRALASNIRPGCGKEGCHAGVAMSDDDAFLKAIDEADPDTFGVTCAECGCFHIGKFSEMGPTEAHCPDCGSDQGSFESPALGGGKPSVRSAARSPLPSDQKDGGGQ